jgi:hypothetical protein
MSIVNTPDTTQFPLISHQYHRGRFGQRERALHRMVLLQMA